MDIFYLIMIIVYSEAKGLEWNRVDKDKESFQQDFMKRGAITNE